MKKFITYILFFCCISPCLCTRWNWNIKSIDDVNYNVMQYGARGDGISDDSQAFSTAWNNVCKAQGMSTLVIPAEKTFLVTGIKLTGPCNGEVLIQLQGQIVAPSKSTWENDGKYLISIDNVEGLTIDGNDHGEIDGNGSTWWSCRSCDRPGVLHFHACNSLNVKDLRISNSPRSHISVNMCDGATFSHVSINSPSTSPNTDGFDISESTNILIQDSDIKAGDDCIAINGGSSFINATRVTCGPSHGISVGSLGKNSRVQDKVSDIYVQNCTFIESKNGARIKTFHGGSGYAKQINFEDIILQNVKNPIIIDQHYDNIMSTPTDVEDVEVSGVTYRGFTGTSATDAAIDFDCSPSGCFDIVLDQINIVSAQSGEKTSAFCRNAHVAATNTTPNVYCQ